MASVQVADRWHRTSPPTDDAEPCKCGTKAYPFASADHGTGQRWLVRYRDQEGRQRKIAFERKPDATRKAAQVKASMDGGTYVDPAGAKVTFRAVAAEWQQAVGHGHRASTAANVDRQLRLHILPALGDREIGKITKQDVQAFVTELTSKLSPSTVEVVYGVARSVFAFAVGTYVQANPCVSATRSGRVRLPSKAQPEVTPLSAVQIGALIEASPARYRALILLAAASGLRFSELVGLEVRNVKPGEIVVAQQLVPVAGGSLCVGPPKTRASRRAVPVPEAVTEALGAHLEAFPVAPREMADTTRSGTPARAVRLVFSTATGYPLQRSPWAREWKRIVERANRVLGEDDQLPAGATMHDARHFYASALIHHGESVKVVQGRLGHASASTTLDIYGHLFPSSEASTRAAITEALGGLLQGTPRAQDIEKSGDVSGSAE